MPTIRIIALPTVRLYLRELVQTLYDKGYFGFEEFAQQYVDDLIADIRTDLSVKLHKPAPPYFDRYGRHMLYAAFRKNKGTQWYVFFTLYRRGEEIIYLIRYINNNHFIAQYL